MSGLRRVLVLTALAALLSGCSSDATPGRARSSPGKQSEPTGAGELDERHIAAAKLDLSNRAGYPTSEIEVVAVERVTWPNAALGCPSSGREYEPNPVPGYRVVLRWKDVQVRYHAPSDGRLSLCEYLD